MRDSDDATGLPAAQRLRSALSGLSAGEMADLSDRAGVTRRIGARARAGRRVNASAYLALCGAAGIDPETGTEREPRTVGEVLWWFVGAGLFLTRLIRNLSLRAAAEIAGVTASTLCRVENAQAVSVDNFLAVAAFIGVPPDGFTGNTNCNTLNNQEAHP